MSKGSCLILLGLAAVLFTLSGCSKPKVVGKPHVHHADLELTLCGLCGETKGDAKCCKEGAELCSICGLHKGSVLCCSTAINGRRDVILCRKCGEVAFSSKCCKEGAVACPKCGLHKGSPGDCKIERVAAGDPSKASEHAHEGGHDGHSG
jgi:hypothetical protein